MAVIKRTREIKTKTRNSTGGFKIECADVGAGDTLHITITHADHEGFKKEYTVEGEKLIGRDSISFKVWNDPDPQKVRVAWQGDIQPKFKLNL